ncbi:MAG: hypothetical protein GY909_15170 [Oligoflexia bacterium]|nr:hypothetical protein [Oligoflexia bacterium]
MELSQIQFIYGVGYSVLFLIALEVLHWCLKLIFRTITKLLKPDYQSDKNLIELLSLTVVLLTVILLVRFGYLETRAIVATLVFAVFEFLSMSSVISIHIETKCENPNLNEK